MEARKLTDEEVDRLFDFCTKHYVPEYDLQIELVDHLASGIEEQWAKTPDLPFPVALNNTFDQFGIFGFSKIKSQKEKELCRKYRKLFWKYTLEFYKLPKVVLTFVITFVLFTVYRAVNNYYWTTLSIFLIIIFVDLLYVWRIYPSKYALKTKDDKSFIIVNYLKGRQLGINLILQIPLQGIQILDHFNYPYLNHVSVLAISSFIITILLVFMYIFFFVVPVKIKEHFSEQFPQFIKS